MLGPWSQTLSPRTVRNIFLLIGHPVGYLVICMWRDWHTTLYDPATPLVGTYTKYGKKDLEEIFAYPCSQKHYLQQPTGSNNPNVHWQVTGQTNVVNRHNRLFGVEKKALTQSFAATWMTLGNIMLSEMKQSQIRQIIYNSLYGKYLQ